MVYKKFDDNVDPVRGLKYVCLSIGTSILVGLSFYKNEYKIECIEDELLLDIKFIYVNLFRQISLYVYIYIYKYILYVYTYIYIYWMSYYFSTKFRQYGFITRIKIRKKKYFYSTHTHTHTLYSTFLSYRTFIRLTFISILCNYVQIGRLKQEKKKIKEPTCKKATRNFRKNHR